MSVLLDTSPALGPDAFPQRMAALSRRLGGEAVAEPTRISAGATLETWKFEVETDQGRRAFVLRRSPGVRPDIALSLADEAKLVTLAANAGLPVARPVHVLDDDDGLGEGFVMPCIEGETLPRRILTAPALAGARTRLVAQMARIAARIHAIDAANLGWLKTVDIDVYLDQLRRLIEELDHPRPVFAFAFRWLADHRPSAPTRARLVHGDFRIGNVMVGSDGVRAMLDWEGAHLGDPMEDLAWFCLPPWRFGALHRPAGGLGDRESLHEAYEQASGTAVDRARVRYWEALGSLRWGLMCADMIRWVRGGEDASIERAMIARRASESEIDLLRVIAPRGDAA